jgi:large subunit ribosomal protein L13
MRRRKNFETWIPKGGPVARQWWIVDATDVILGRLATRVATVLMGKHKPNYTPFIDTGDFVVVTNCDKVKFTGEKLEERTRTTYSKYKGGVKTLAWKDEFKDDPGQVIRRAVKLMLPKTTIGRHYIMKLKTYKGDKHPHAAQKPEKLELTKVRGGRVWLRSTSGVPAAGKAP